MQRFHHTFGVLLTFLMLATSSGLAAATDGTTADPPDTIPTAETAAQTAEPLPEKSSGQDEQAAPAQTVDPPTPVESEPGPGDITAEETLPTEPVDAGNPPTGPPAPGPAIEEEMNQASLEEGEPADPETVVADDVPAEPDVDPEDTTGTTMETQAFTAQATEELLVIHIHDDRTDLPIAGVTVTIKDALGDTTFASGVTGTDGTFSATLPLGDYYLDATAPGYFSDFGRQVTVWDPGFIENVLKFWMLPIVNGALTVTVINWDTNAVVPGAQVVVSDANGVPVASGTTNESGDFVSGELAAGPYSVTVSADGFETREYFNTTIDGPTAAKIAIRPIVGGTLTLRILNNEDDTPLAGASVTITHSDAARTPFASGTSGTDGTLTYNDVPGGYYVAQVTLTGFLPAIDYFFEVRGDTSRDIYLVPAVGGTMTITTLIAGTDTPIANATVTVVNVGGTTVATGATNASGTWVSNELAYGEYTVNVTADGYKAASDLVKVDGGANRNFYLSPKPVTPRDQTITVLDMDDGPVASATVTFTSMETDAVVSGTTNASGVVVLSLLDGQYGVEISAAGYETASTSRDTTGTDAATFYLSKLAPGTLTVEVRDYDSNALLSGVTVQIAGTTISGTTNASGTYASPELPDGTYEVTLSKDGYIAGTYTRQVRGNVTLSAWLQEEREGTLTIYALTEAQTPIVGAQVTVFEIESVSATFEIVLGDVVAQGTTDSEGKFTSPTAVPSGYYLIDITAAGYTFAGDDEYINGDFLKVYKLAATGGETPVPSETPVVTPEPSETPVVTPEPSETPDPGVTPQPSVTPEPSETPVVTPDPSETPVVTPEPSETPVVTPDPSKTPAPSETPVVTPGPTTPAEESPLTVSLEICANDACDAPHSTGLDGFTATWTIAGEQTAVMTQIESAKLASFGGSGEPVSLTLMQQQSLTLIAVIQDGVATGTSEPLPVGLYTVCLDPVLTGPAGETVQIADETVCTVVTLTVNGVDGGSGTAFQVIDTTDPDDGNPAEPTDPGTPGEPDNPTTPHQPTNPQQPGTTPDDPSETDGPGTGDPATDPVDNDAGTGSANTGSTGELAVVVSAGTSGSGNETADAPGGSTESVSGLPTTGSGTPDATSSATAWSFAMSAVMLMALAIVIRQRSEA